jgi:hypothetical protein
MAFIFMGISIFIVNLRSLYKFVKRISIFRDGHQFNLATIASYGGLKGLVTKVAFDLNPKATAF